MPTSRRTVRLGWRRLRVDGGYVLTWLRLVWSAENYFKERKIILGTSKSISAPQNNFPQFSANEKKKKRSNTQHATQKTHATQTLRYPFFYSLFVCLFPRRGSRPCQRCQGRARIERRPSKLGRQLAPRKIVVTMRPLRERYIRCHSDKNRYYTWS